MSLARSGNSIFNAIASSPASSTVECRNIQHKKMPVSKSLSPQLGCVIGSKLHLRSPTLPSSLTPISSTSQNFHLGIPLVARNPSKHFSHAGSTTKFLVAVRASQNGSSSNGSCRPSSSFTTAPGSGLSSPGPGQVSFHKGTGLTSFRPSAIQDAASESPLVDAVRTSDNSTSMNGGAVRRGLPHRTGPGFVSFRSGSGLASFLAADGDLPAPVVLSGKEEEEEEEEAEGKKKSTKADKKGRKKEGLKAYTWLVGPLILFASIAFPSSFLRGVLELFLGNTVLTDFVAIFATDAAFVAGAAFFLFWVHDGGMHLRSTEGQVPWVAPWARDGLPAGYSSWSRTLNLLGVLLPVLSIVLARPFGVGPLASAAFLPYLAVLGAQLYAESRMHQLQSPAAPIVPLIFQMYRLHQINRGAQLVYGILAALQSPNPTDKVITAAAALTWVLYTLQLLGLLWVCNMGIAFSVTPWMYSNWSSNQQPRGEAKENGAPSSQPPAIAAGAN